MKSTKSTTSMHKLVLSKGQLIAWSDNAITDNFIRRALSGFAAWKQAWTGEGFDFDLLPEKQQLKLFPAKKSLADKRKAVANALAGITIAQLQEEELSGVERLKGLVKPDLSGIQRVLETGCNQAEAMAYCRMAGWCSLLASGEKMGYSKKAELWSDALTAMQEEFGNNLLPGKITNLRVLQNKVTTWKKGGIVSLVDSRKNNKNAERFQAWAKALAYDLYTDKQKLLVPELYRRFCERYMRVISTKSLEVSPQRNSRGQIVDTRNRPAKWELPFAWKLNYIDQETGELIEVEPVSFETFRAYLKSDQVQRMAVKFRHGRKFYDDNYRPDVRTERPKFSLSIVSGDDYHLNFWLTIDGKKTAKRPIVYIIWDTVTGIPVGFAFAEEGGRQTLDLMFEAIYDAVMFTGVIPSEIEIDGFGKGPELEARMKSIFQRYSIRKRAQGKLAEHFNRMSQDTYWRNKEGYLGDNVQSRKQDSKRNSDNMAYPHISLNMVKKEFMRYRMHVCGQEYKPGMTKHAFLMNRINPACERPTPARLAALFGGMATRSIKKDLIELDINKEIRTYQVPLRELLSDSQKSKYLREDGKVRVRWIRPAHTQEWSESMANEVYLFGIVDEENPLLDVYLCPVHELGKVQRAQIEQTAEDKQLLGKRLQEGKAHDEWVDEYRENQLAMVAAYDPESLQGNEYLFAKWADEEGTTEKDITIRAQQGIDNNLFGRDVNPDYTFLDE